LMAYLKAQMRVGYLGNSKADCWEAMMVHHLAIQMVNLKESLKAGCLDLSLETLMEQLKL
jgi:hypothetical protein